MINGIEDHHNFRVRIHMPVTGIQRLYERLDYWESVKEWIDQSVEWDDDAYSLQFTVPYVDVWFKDPKHATMCQLRWS